MAGDTSSDVTPIPDVRFVFKNVVFLSKLGKCRSHQQFGTIKQLVDGVQRHTDGSCFLHIGKYQVTLTQGKKELGSWKGQTWDLAYGSNGWCLCDQLHCSSGEDNGEWGRTRERIRKAHIRDPGKLINTSAIGKKREGPIGRTADGTSEDANKRIKLEARQNAEEGDKPGTTSTAPPRTQSEAMIVVKQEGHA